MGPLLITGWGSAMITWRVAMIMLQWQIAAGGPSHFVGPFPFREPMPPSAICHCNLLCTLKERANAALGYLPLQLALRAEGRKLKICPGKGRFLQQVVFHDLCKQKSRIFHSKHDTKVVPKLQKNANFGTTSLFHIFSK